MTFKGKNHIVFLITIFIIGSECLCASIVPKWNPRLVIVLCDRQHTIVILSSP